jgi:hypothetical protein
MKSWKSGRPSPALVIALVALFAALGGSAYAATKIGTKQIKNGAITASKLKKEAVTAAKIKNGAISGAKLDLAQLGTVPSANHASTADTAGKANEATKAGEATKALEAEHARTADSANLAANFSRYFTTGVVRANVGEKVTLWQAGPFTATGICEEIVSGEIEAYSVLTTSVPHAAMDSHGYEYYRANFEPGEEAEIGDYARGKEGETEVSTYEGSYRYSGFTAVSPDGHALLNGVAYNAVHYFGADCAFFDEFHNGG